MSVSYPLFLILLSAGQLVFVCVARFLPWSFLSVHFWFWWLSLYLMWTASFAFGVVLSLHGLASWVLPALSVAVALSMSVPLPDFVAIGVPACLLVVAIWQATATFHRRQKPF